MAKGKFIIYFREKNFSYFFKIKFPLLQATKEKFTITNSMSDFCKIAIKYFNGRRNFQFLFKNISNLEYLN